VTARPSTSDRTAPPQADPAGATDPPPAPATAPGGAVQPRTQPGRVQANGEGGPTPEPAQAADPRVEELEEQLRRALADFDNLRKRVARETALARSQERATVARDFLPVLDNLELALSHAGADPIRVQEGIEAVHDQAVAILTRLGFPPRDPLGERFDPARHEAVSTVPDEEADAGTIVHVVHPGYGDGEHQLRPAAVVVATKGP
jgi:molecular chaperone GrpE